MKKMLLSAMICVLSFTNFAQFLNSSDSLIYTDATYKVLYSGTFSVYDLNGKLFRKIKVLNGQLNGGCYWYYPDGQLWANMHYQNNILHGDQTIYYQNGQLKSKEYFVEGTIHGYNVHYYENGKIQEEANFNHGVWEGKYAFYDVNGVLWQGGYCKQNKPVGTWVMDNGPNGMRTVLF